MRRMFFAAAVALGLGAVSPISNAAVTVETVSGREFVQFGLSFPRAQNPAFDKNGDDCYAGQHGDTWYLAASFGGTTVRSCESRPSLFPFGLSFLHAARSQERCRRDS